MKKILEILKNKADLVISVPAILCFITFTTNLIHALKDGNIDEVEYHRLLATADGFETILLFAVSIALRSQKK